MAHNQEKYSGELTPVMLNGEVIPFYYLDKNGDLYSINHMRFVCPGGDWARKIRWVIAGGSKYPRCTLMINGTRKTVNLHKVVAETFIKKPLPFGVSESDWKTTPDSVKACFDHFWEVNHIDHDPENFHPSNLEWVSRNENVSKYQIYRKNAEYA